MIGSNFPRILYMMVVSLLLSGCAADRAYLAGQRQMADRDYESGVASFQRASELDPDSAQYREASLNARNTLVTKALQEGFNFAEKKNFDEAEKLFKRVLSYEASNARALAGLSTVAAERRHIEWLQQANASLKDHDLESAKAKLSSILAESPDDQQARSLLREMEGSANAAALEKMLSKAYQQPITLDFKEATLKQVFEVIGRTAGLNIIFDKDVKQDQKSSISLKNSTVESAIYFMLLSNQLEQQVMDANTILIYPNNAAKQKDYQQTLVKSFLLTNAKAKTVAEALKSLLKPRDIVVDEKLNMLMVRDSPEAIALMAKIIALQDIAEPEVMLELEVLEVSREKLLNLGITPPGSLSLTPLSKSGASNLVLSDLTGLSKSTVGATVDPLLINAQQTDSDVEILANPRIRVINHEKAKVLVGDRVPSISTTAVASGTGALVAEAVTYVDVGLKLEVEPTVYLNNDVAIRVGLEVNNIVNTTTTARGTVAYTVGTRTANTMLRLKDGENQILAGLINNEVDQNVTKLPGLGDIPLLGRFFGGHKNDKKKTEILLSITPHLIRNIQRQDADISEFLSGTDSSLRHRPDFKPVAAVVEAQKASLPAVISSQTKDVQLQDAQPAVLPVATPLSPADNKKTDPVEVVQPKTE